MNYLYTFEKFGSEILKNSDSDKLKNFIKTVRNAKKFAKKAHYGVNRKSGEPYYIHPHSVAKIVHDVKESEHIGHIIAAAYLHDTVEDTNITLEDIRLVFGDIVMNLVDEVTNDKEKMAISGKEDYLIDKMIGMSSWALVIKLADRLHNLSDFEDIMNSEDKSRKKWAKKYAKQTKNIIKELEMSRDLSNSQQTLVDNIKDKLKIVLVHHDD